MTQKLYSRPSSSGHLMIHQPAPPHTTNLLSDHSSHYSSHRPEDQPNTACSEDRGAPRVLSGALRRLARKTSPKPPTPRDSKRSKSSFRRVGTVWRSAVGTGAVRRVCEEARGAPRWGQKVGTDHRRQGGETKGWEAR